MIGQVISHDKILEKLGEARPNDLLLDIKGIRYDW
jgi:hypothetical protein